jgi:hypothetical protein
MKDDREVERVLTEWLITQNKELNQQEGGKKAVPLDDVSFMAGTTMWKSSTIGYELLLLELRMKQPEYTYAYRNLCYKHPVEITYKLYLNNPSITTKFLRFSESSIHYDMFRPARPFFGVTQYYPLYKNQMSIFIGLYITNTLPSILYTLRTT